MRANTLLIPRLPLLWRVLGCLLCSSLLSIPGCAQTLRENNARVERDCLTAVDILSQGASAPRAGWALERIKLCKESGGSVIKSLWMTPPTEATALEQLVQASARLLDQRVYDGVIANARNSSAPRATRLAALRVLAAFVDDGTLITQDALAKPALDTNITAQFSTISEGMGHRIGSQPMLASDQSDIRALFASLATTDADPIVRRAGKNLTNWFNTR